MDFEFNKSTTTSSNGVTPVRTAGDLLITYDLSKGGTVPVLSLREWTGSQWGPETNLTTSGDATGSINTSPIASANSEGLGALDPRTFGEASVDLDAIFDAGKCDSFGSAYLKSRSSDSFDAALKDFIAPQPVNIANCGSVIIRKQTDPDENPNATNFSFESTLVADPADATAASFTLQDDGSKTVSNVVADTGYTVEEVNLAATGYVLSGIDCSASSTGSTYTTDVPNQTVTFNVAVGKTIDCTFTNTRLPKVKLVKDLIPAADAGTFNLDISQGGNSKASASAIGDGGAAPASGFVTVAAGSVTVSETAAGTTALADYAKSIACTGKTGNTGQASYTFNIANGEEVTCTITNTRLPKVKLVKDLIPAADAGTFNLDISQGGSKASASAIGDGGAAPASGFVTVAAGSVTVSETAAGTHGSGRLRQVDRLHREDRKHGSGELHVQHRKRRRSDLHDHQHAKDVHGRRIRLRDDGRHGDAVRQQRDASEPRRHAEGDAVVAAERRQRGHALRPRGELPRALVRRPHGEGQHHAVTGRRRKQSRRGRRKGRPRLTDLLRAAACEHGVLAAVRAPRPADERVGRGATGCRYVDVPCSVVGKPEHPTNGSRAVADHEVQHLVRRQAGAPHDVVLDGARPGGSRRVTTAPFRGDRGHCGTQERHDGHEGDRGSAHEDPLVEKWFRMQQESIGSDRPRSNTRSRVLTCTRSSPNMAASAMGMALGPSSICLLH